MKIHISPLDTVAFMSGKPFTMGEETAGEQVFPPYPSTLFGAVVSAVALQKNGEKPDFQSVLNRLKITSIFLVKDGKRMYPMPKDCALVDEKKDESTHRVQSKTKLLKLENNTDITNNTLPMILKTGEGHVKSADDQLFREIDFKGYLTGSNDVFDSQPLSDFISSDFKVGIARDNNSRTASEGKLYRVEMKRMEKDFSDINKIAFEVEFEGGELPEQGVLKLGAENKSASYLKVDSVLPEFKVPSGDVFKVYLATPAIFNKGWQPTYFEGKAQLVATAMGKPMSIGGFDLAKKWPKEMVKAVPAGSVYYYQWNSAVTQQERVDILQQINGKSISEARVNEGFGIALVGEVKL